LDAFREESIRKGLVFSIEFRRQEILHNLVGDPYRLRQVISNLLVNAVQASNFGGITVEAQPVEITKARFIIGIAFQDSGQGYSEEELNDLFQDIEQIIDNTKTSSASSQNNQNELGLGLAVVARFVRNSKGQMKIQSEKGNGTRISVLLPFRTAGQVISKIAAASSATDLLPTPPSASTINEKEHTNVRYSSVSQSNHLTFKKKEKNASEVVVKRPASVCTQLRAIESISAAETSSLSTRPPSARILNNDRLTILDDLSCDKESQSLSDNSYPFPVIQSSLPTYSNEKLYILIAEDNPINSRILKQRLEKMGHKVETTSNGSSCADAFKAKPYAFDLVLMDIQVLAISPKSGRFRVLL
jgi:Histidine kinase-, DNA gyrase B-, and HSP90-like ATPase/Response regulator receiver domain